MSHLSGSSLLQVPTPSSMRHDQAPAGHLSDPRRICLYLRRVATYVVSTQVSQFDWVDMIVKMTTTTGFTYTLCVLMCIYIIIAKLISDVFGITKHSQH